ncbi:MAG: hypothetical protein OHK0046_42030 [Anaerolineae bacterium]
MPEMTLPGTALKVQSARHTRITATVGIVGTARLGSTDPTPLTSIDEAVQHFGSGGSTEHYPLTLVQAVQLAFANGAPRVVAVRVPGELAETAIFALQPPNAPPGPQALTFMAVAPGQAYNAAQIDIEPTHPVNGALGGTPQPPHPGAGHSGSGLPFPPSFPPGTTPPPNTLTLTITLGDEVERWEQVPDAAAQFVQVVNGTHTGYDYNKYATTGGASALFKAAYRNMGPVPGEPLALASLNQSVTPGPVNLRVSGTDGYAPDYVPGLDRLLNEDLQFVVLAGQGLELAADLIAHVEAASQPTMQRERLGIIGSTTTTLADLLENIPRQAEGRLIVVAPGIRVVDPYTRHIVTLPATYTAAAVAGCLSALAPHESATNKRLHVAGLERQFNHVELGQLVAENILMLENQVGSVRIVRGVAATEPNSEWAQITTRRVADDVLRRVRLLTDGFLHLQNTLPVRHALKSRVHELLGGMVAQGVLTRYSLSTSVSDDDSIPEALTLHLAIRPIFSLDYVHMVIDLEGM